MTDQMQATLSRLSTRDLVPLQALLMRDPIINVYLLSEIREGVLTSDWWGVVDDGRIRSAMLSGPLVVPYITEDSDASGLGRVLRDERRAVRMMVGPRDSVMSLHGSFGRPAHDIKQSQPVLLLNRGGLRGNAQPTPLRHAIRADLEQLTEAAAAMHQEELGIDPIQVDPEGWRIRMAQLMQRNWSWVWTEGGTIVFKAELSAWTPRAAQIQGVYTHPAWRGRGVASAAMRQLCAELLEQTQACTLYVNQYNTAGRRLYERLGFEELAEFATVIY
jgi:uncharacterized protein